AARALLGDPVADRGFLEAKIATAQFFAEHLLPRAAAHGEAVAAGAGSTMALDESAF
ncbi:MAG: acyl-CoA dehydrogenase C-terminal domain-containing protein, partial [Gemmatimonadales bacterium]|nr:acyl-CoA dehydrogenase C-terminal domain-containing protein [Gemmatimonadales bacterium]